jgi:hypothetical protein
MDFAPKIALFFRWYGRAAIGGNAKFAWFRSKYLSSQQKISATPVRLTTKMRQLGPEWATDFCKHRHEQRHAA